LKHSFDGHQIFVDEFYDSGLALLFTRQYSLRHTKHYKLLKAPAYHKRILLASILEEFGLRADDCFVNFESNIPTNDLEIRVALVALEATEELVWLAQRGECKRLMYREIALTSFCLFAFVAILAHCCLSLSARTRRMSEKVGLAIKK